MSICYVLSALPIAVILIFTTIITVLHEAIVVLPFDRWYDWVTQRLSPLGSLQLKPIFLTLAGSFWQFRTYSLGPPLDISGNLFAHFQGIRLPSDKILNSRWLSLLVMYLKLNRFLKVTSTAAFVQTTSSSKWMITITHYLFSASSFL